MKTEVVDKFLHMHKLMQNTPLHTNVSLFGIDSTIDNYKKGMKSLSVKNVVVRQQDITKTGTTLENSEVLIDFKLVGVICKDKFFAITKPEPTETKPEVKQSTEKPKARKPRAPKVATEKA